MSIMRRIRAAVVVCGLMFAWPLPAAAQQAASPSHKGPTQHLVTIHPFKHVKTGPLRSMKPTSGGGGSGQSDGATDDFQYALPDHTNAPDGALDAPTTVPSAPSPGTGWDGIDIAHACGNCYPPDTNGAVGPNNFVQTVNESFEVWNKSGQSLLGPESISTLWSTLGGVCSTSGYGDPIVTYDTLADRWLISQFAFSNSSGPYDECIGVSTSPDPTGTWNVWAYTMSQTDFPDYPKFGVWPDGYYMSTVWFTHDSSYGGPKPFVFDRVAMLSGAASPSLQTTSSALGSSKEPLLPADFTGSIPPPAGAPDTFVGVNSGLDLYHMSFSADSWSGPTTLGVDTWTELCPGTYRQACIPQPGTTQGLASLGDRLMFRASYRNFGDHEALVVNHTVNVAMTGNRAGVRWYEIRNPSSSPSLYQQGTFAPADDVNRWMGSAAMDNAGNMAIGYSASNGSTTNPVYPSLRYAGRLAGDPAGTLAQGEATLFAGQASQTVIERWGDYSDLTVDPSDDCTFWYTNEYYPAGDNGWHWHTRIGSFRFTSDQCVSHPVTHSTQLSVTSASGQYGGSAGTVTATLTTSPMGSVPCGGTGPACIPVPNKSITFTLNGASVATASTNSQGVATLSSPSLSNIHAGTYATGVGASFAGDAMYVASNASNTLNVATAPLTITPNSQSKVYGATLLPLSWSANFVNGDNADSLTQQPTCITSATSSSHVAGSPYSITCSDAVDPDYTISYATGAQVTVTPAPLTITADNKSIDYGASIPDITWSANFVNGDTADSLSQQPNCVTPATSTSDVGSYDITCSDAADSDYTIGYSNGQLTISQALLTVTPDGQSKVYGVALPNLTYKITGFQNGQDASALSQTPSCGTTATAASHVGSYDITCSGGLAKNYSFTYLGAQLNITPAPLTITPDNKSKVYGAALPLLTWSANFVNGDTADSLSQQPNCTTTATQHSHVAGSPYTITCSGGVDSDYTISYATGAQLTVTPASLMITPDSQSKVYGADLPSLTWSANFVNGDAASSLSQQPNCITTATQSSHVAGSPYTITCSGAADSDYTISYATGAQLTVTPAALKITADNKSLQYSDPIPSLTWSASGLVNGDTKNTLTTAPNSGPNCSTTATGTSPNGVYPIACSGTVDPDYSINYVNGTYTVTQEVASIAYTGDYSVALPSSGFATLNLRATVWDSAAQGYPGPADPDGLNSSNDTPGDVTRMYVEFDLYPAGGCLTGTPTAYRVAVSATSTPGVGTATYAFTSATEGAYCVVARVVASGGTANQYYSAPDAPVQGLSFYQNTGQFATGGGWLYDPPTGTTHGNFGFTARYNSKSSPKGQAVYIWRAPWSGTVNGVTYTNVMADYIVKSNALGTLTFSSGTTYPMSATLTGKCTYQIVRESNDAPLFSEGNDTFTAVATDGDGPKSPQVSSKDQFSITLVRGSNTVAHQVQNVSLQGGNLTVRNG